MVGLIIDVSHYQPSIDWQVAHSVGGVEAAWIKASEGTAWTDPMFETYRQQARAAGVKIGAYHFARQSEPEREAANFLRVVGDGGTDLIPMLDVEIIKGTEADWIAFWKTWRKIVGDSFFYTYSAWLQKHPGLLNVVPVNRLWIAKYSNVQPRTCAMWQYTSRGKVPGIQGSVDLNKWMLSERDWEDVHLRHVRYDESMWKLVKRPDDPTVWVTDGVRLVKKVPNPHIRDILLYGLRQPEVAVITDQEFWSWLAGN
jgi:GH25 family lysozyme M1 (1,4-beta-N-acetylmuramidase)